MHGANTHTNGVRARIEGGYRDDPEEEAEAANNHVATARTATDNAGPENHGPIVQPSRLRQEGNEWENH